MRNSSSCTIKILCPLWSDQSTRRATWDLAHGVHGGSLCPNTRYDGNLHLDHANLPTFEDQETPLSNPHPSLRFLFGSRPRLQAKVLTRQSVGPCNQPQYQIRPSLYNSFNVACAMLLTDLPPTPYVASNGAHAMEEGPPDASIHPYLYAHKEPQHEMSVLLALAMLLRPSSPSSDALYLASRARVYNDRR